MKPRLRPSEEQVHTQNEGQSKTKNPEFQPLDLETRAASQIKFEKRLKDAFGELSFKNETLPSSKREWTKTFIAHITSRKDGKVINPFRIDEEAVVATVALRVDHFRPYLRVSTKVTTENGKHEIDEEDTLEDKPGDIVIEEELAATIEAQYIY